MSKIQGLSELFRVALILIFLIPVTKKQIDMHNQHNKIIYYIFIFLYIFLIPNKAFSSERIDLDYKYTTESVSDFYSLSEYMSGLDNIELNGELYTIKKSVNEVFVDAYYDTELLDLYNNDDSIRYRQRYRNSKLMKRLVQYKTKHAQVEGAMNEYKIKIKRKEKINTDMDLLRYLSRESIQKSKLVKKFKDKYDMSSLSKVVLLFQNRNRFYLYNEIKEHVFTVTFDSVHINSSPLNTPYWVIEFEINEKLMGRADNNLRDSLQESVMILIDKFVNKYYSLNKVMLSKYQVAVNSLNSSGTENIKNYSGNKENIFLLLFSLIVMMVMFYFTNKKI